MIDLGQLVFGFIAVVIAFIAGMIVGAEPARIDRREYDERRNG